MLFLKIRMLTGLILRNIDCWRFVYRFVHTDPGMMCNALNARTNCFPRALSNDQFHIPSTASKEQSCLQSSAVDRKDLIKNPLH